MAMRRNLLFLLLAACGPVTSYDHLSSAWDEHASARVHDDLVAVAPSIESRLDAETTQNQHPPVVMRWIGARGPDYETQADGSRSVRIAYVFEWEHRCYLHGERDPVMMVRGADGPRVDDPSGGPLLLGMPGVPTIPCSSVSATESGVRLPVGTAASHESERGANCLALHFGGDAANLARAKVECAAACKEDRDRDACAVLGMMYERGEGVPRDAARATELYGEACKMGSTRACEKTR